jgi:hypothetical protein
MKKKEELPISLINNENFNIVQMDTCTILQMVNKPSWRRHNNIRTFLQLGLLNFQAQSTHHKTYRDISVFCKSKCNCVTLKSKLTGRKKNKTASCRNLLGSVKKTCEKRYEERQCFTRTFIMMLIFRNKKLKKKDQYQFELLHIDHDRAN